MLLPERILFDSFFDDFGEKNKNNSMKCDIYESDKNYEIEMDIPGYKKEDIKIELSNGYLMIATEKKSIVDDDNRKCIRRERYYSKTMRQFYVGDIDEDNIKAEFKDGILKVIVPKETKEKETKKIINID